MRYREKQVIAMKNGKTPSITKDQKLVREIVYYDNKVSSDINFEYNGNYLTKLYYLDKFGGKNKEPVEVIF